MQDSVIWLVTAFFSIGYASSLFNPRTFTFIIIVLFYLRPMEKGLYPYPIMMVGLLIAMLVLVFHRKPYGMLSTCVRDDTKFFLLMQLYLLFNIILFNRWNIVDIYQVYIIPAIILFFLISEYMNTVGHARTLLFILGVSCLLICVDSLYVHFNAVPNTYVWNLYHDGERLQNQGFWDNPNILGYISNFGIGCFYVVYSLSKSPVKKAYFLSSLIFLPTIFLTGSRGAFLQTCVFIGLIFIQNKRGLKTVIFFSSLIFISLTYLTVLSPERQYAEGSRNERLDILLYAKEAFEDNPIFGIGFRLFSEYNPYHLVSHNTFAQLFAELGIVGVIIFFVMLKTMIHGCHSVIKKTKDKDEFSDINKLAVGVFTISISAFVYYAFGNQLLDFIFCTTIALLVMVKRIYEIRIDSISYSK